MDWGKVIMFIAALLAIFVAIFLGGCGDLCGPECQRDRASREAAIDRLIHLDECRRHPDAGICDRER